MINELKKNKKFEAPMLEVIEFTNDDIITGSGDFGNTGNTPGDVFPKTNGWW